MYRHLLILTVLLLGCKAENHPSISLIELADSSTYVDKIDELYLFKQEKINGIPFTESFCSYSNIKGYSITKHQTAIAFDTTVFSSNSYTDIHFYKSSLDSLDQKIKLIFSECMDGDDPCSYKEVSLQYAN